MSNKHERRSGHSGIELIDLPDEPTGRFERLPDQAHDADPARAKRRRRNQRLKFSAAVVAAAAALAVAWQLIPNAPVSHNANKPVRQATMRTPVSSRNTEREPSTSASIKATNEAGTDAMSLGTTSGDCDLTGLRDAYPDAGAIATGIRSAVVDHLDRRDRHVQSPSGQVNCVWPNGSGKRELELLLTWTSGAGKGLIVVTVANFDDPTMTGCGTGWSCAPPSRKRVHNARSARVIRDTGDRGFGVRVQRKDGQYVSILADAMPLTDNDVDPTLSLNHFPFAAKKLLTVSVDPRVHLDRMITPPH